MLTVVSLLYTETTPTANLCCLLFCVLFPPSASLWLNCSAVSSNHTLPLCSKFLPYFKHSLMSWLMSKNTSHFTLCFISLWVKAARQIGGTLQYQKGGKQRAVMVIKYIKGQVSGRGTEEIHLVDECTWDGAELVVKEKGWGWGSWSAREPDGASTSKRTRRAKQWPHIRKANTFLELSE